MAGHVSFTDRRVGGIPLMAAGLFELRLDAITGWWVATVVDRQFDRRRFALAAAAVDDGAACRSLGLPPGDGIRVRTLKDYAFHVVGAQDEARELERSLAQVAMAQARASGSWRTVVAPPGEHQAASDGRRRDAPCDARRGPQGVRRGGEARSDRVPPGGPELGGASGRWNEPSLHRPLRPAADPASGRRGDRGRSLLPDPRTRVPVLPAGARGAESGDADDLGGRRQRRLPPYASRSPFEVWVVPRRHAADFAGATDADIASTAGALRQAESPGPAWSVPAVEAMSASVAPAKSAAWRRGTEPNFERGPRGIGREGDAGVVLQMIRVPALGSSRTSRQYGHSRSP